MIITFEGPDGVGKTTLSKHVSEIMNIPYFKVSTENENWRNGTFKESLAFDLLVPQLADSAIGDIIFDRSYPSEYVYSSVFGRQTDIMKIKACDREFMIYDALHVIVLRSEGLPPFREDEKVSLEKYHELVKGYESFANWTTCNTIVVYNDFEGNVKNLAYEIVNEIESYNKDFRRVNLRSKQYGYDIEYKK